MRSIGDWRAARETAAWFFSVSGGLLSFTDSSGYWHREFSGSGPHVWIVGDLRSPPGFRRAYVNFIFYGRSAKVRLSSSCARTGCGSTLS
jgi:hypothetical protein